MKKYFLFLLSLVLFFLSGSLSVLAQGTTSARQVIIANGGKFESTPPYADYVTIESYNLSTQAVTVFNTIYTQSTQDVLVSDNFAFVTAEDSIVKYNIDTYQRLAAVKDSGINKLGLYNNNRLIITKEYPIGRFRVEVLNADDLSMIALVDSIAGDCQGVCVYNNHAYVAVDSGYQGINGRMAIIDATTWKLESIVNFGPTAVGSRSVYPYGGYIYCVNKTPYGGGTVGSITRYDPATGTFVTNVLNVKVGPGYGIAGNLLFLGINNSIGSYNLDTQAIADTAIINYFGSAGAVEIHSVGVDYLNNKFYTNIGNRTSYSKGFVFSFAGDSLTSYTTGLNSDACAIDFRTPTGVAPSGSVQESVSVYPNPVNDYLFINVGNATNLNEIKILDLTGRTIETRPVREGENNIRISVADYPSGVYLISFMNSQGTKVRKFIKR